MWLMTLFLKYKSTFAITIFIVLILGNLVPVYSIDNHTKHSTHVSAQNQQNAYIEDDGVSGNDSSKAYAVQIMAYCQDGNEHCPMMALDELNKTVSREAVLRTFSDLNLLYDKSDYSCHHEGHHLGWWLYDYTKDLKQALNYATLFCGGSNYHGIFQSYFEREHQVHNIDKYQINIEHLCPIGQENVNWMHERDCIHGIGHGLAKLYNYNTTAAASRCNEFIPLWAQSACSRGIFMENNDHFLETGKGDFDNNDIYSPCDRTVEKFAPQCYYYHPMHLLERNNHSFTDTFAQCDNISPEKFVKYCYEGIGRKLQQVGYRNPEQAIAYCNQGNQPAYHDDCLIGTLKTMLKGDAKTDAAFKFCSLSNLNFKSECYQIVGIWIKAFLYPSHQELERECAKAHDTDYVINCINANFETNVSVPIFEPV
jgi:hypothetical protein